jgi:hypothetical protein
MLGLPGSRSMSFRVDKSAAGPSCLPHLRATELHNFRSFIASHIFLLDIIAGCFVYTVAILPLDSTSTVDAFENITAVHRQFDRWVDP